MLELKDYGPENYGGHGYFLVLNDDFSMFGLIVSLKNKNAQTKKKTLLKI